MHRNIKDWIEAAKQNLQELQVEEIRASGILPNGGNTYSPVIGYPPHTMFPDITTEEVFDGYQQRPANPITAYAHIPFCPSRCTYCHWITKTKSPEQEVDDYLEHIEREMVLYKNALGYDAIPASSALIGGGTPTYLNVAQLERFLEAFTNHFDLSNCSQFSVEAEPTTLLGEEGLARLRVMKDYGVDRISLGVQSFDDPILAAMGRTHNNADSLHAIEQIHKTDFNNLFIDLIYGYPNQSLEQWIENMLTTVSLDINGYQLFRLRINQYGDRRGNIINAFEKDPAHFPDASLIWLMKTLGTLISEHAGYSEQQTNMFARKAEDISHYTRDWCCRLYDIAGVGVSSFSNLRGTFTQNIGHHDLEKYYQPIREGRSPIDRGKVRSADEETRRSFILPLKNEHLDKKEFTRRTGQIANDYFAEEIHWLGELGLLKEDIQTIRLTTRGRFFADEVAAQFFDPRYLTNLDVKKARNQANLKR